MNMKWVYTADEIVIVTGTALTRHNWLTISGLWEHSSHSDHGQTNLLEGPPSNGLACNNHVPFWDRIVTVYRYGSKLYVCCMATAMKFASPGPKVYAMWCIIPYLTLSICIKFSLLVCTKIEHWNVTWVLIHLHCSSKWRSYFDRYVQELHVSHRPNNISSILFIALQILKGSASLTSEICVSMSGPKYQANGSNLGDL